MVHHERGAEQDGDRVPWVADGGFTGGLVIGAAGYLLAVCAFTYGTFYVGGNSPHSAAGLGLGLLVAIASATTMGILIATILRMRDRPRQTTGLLVGAAVGIGLALAFLIPTTHATAGLNTRCPCTPLIQQLPHPPG